MRQLPAGLYAIADAGFGDPVALGAALYEAGCPLVQLRCKGWPDAATERAARALLDVARRHRAMLVINDRVEVAAAVGAHGLHLGQDDGDAVAARRALGPVALIGRSTHDLAQVEAACADPASIDYVGFGPVFPTTTKADASAVRGVDRLASAVAASRVPVVAIGGITADNLEQVRSTRVHAWAVIAALFGAGDLMSAVAAFR